VGLTALLALIAASLPSVYEVERGAVISAPPERVFAQLGDLRTWTSWAVWPRRDTTMTHGYGGPERGVGAAWEWWQSSNGGHGKLSITDQDAPRHLTLQVQFVSPRRATELHALTLTPVQGGTRVTWHVTLLRDFSSRLTSLVLNTDRVVGADLEASLAGLAQACAAPRS
jgi:uncharacterized protein YndB with AHSA1/START domain